MASDTTISSTRESPSEGRRASSARPFLFLVLECGRPRARSERFALGGTEHVLVGRGAERIAQRRGRKLSLVVPDPWMSSRHATLAPVLGRWQIEDAGSRNGVVVNGERQSRAILADRDVIELGHTFFVFRDGLAVAEEDDVDLDPAGGAFASVLPAVQASFQRLAEVARSTVSVILFGETGSGKEVVAREIHRLSQRRGAFVAVNCGALPETLLESELFGHTKGAFSGASADRLGLVRSADHGTLFLDEIGDLPLLSQAAFLRVLQEREVLPIGASRPTAVDVRVISASHRDLQALVEAGAFRADLLARLSGYKFDLPALRARREDLGTIVGALLEKHAPGKDLVIEPRVVRALLRHAWPLNIRELEKVLGAAMVLAGEATVSLEHLPPALQVSPRAVTPAAAPAEEEADDTLPFSSEEIEKREQLMKLLEEHRGNVAAVARTMGKARMQILRWLKRFGLDPERYRR